MTHKKSDTDNVANLTVRILQKIHGEMTGMRQDIHGLRGEISNLREETNANFNKLRGRFDHFLGFAGERYRDHEARITALEKRIKPSRAT